VLDKDQMPQILELVVAVVLEDIEILIQQNPLVEEVHQKQV